MRTREAGSTPGSFEGRKEGVVVEIGYKLIRIAGCVAAAVITAVLAVPAAAQTGGGDLPLTVQAPPALVVRSSPPGATVLLRGPYELVGTTPWSLTRSLSGIYRIEVRRPGYEGWSGEVVVGAGTELDVTLAPKTRIKGLARSLVIPGWGQTYLGASGKGRLFLAAEVAALGGFIWMHELYRDDVRRFDDAADAYRNEPREELLPALRRELNRRSDDADRSYDRQQLVALAGAGVYAVSALDALLFTPASGPPGLATEGADAARTEGPRIQLAASTGPQHGARLGLNLRW